MKHYFGPIEQSNSWVRLAIAAVRVDRNPCTMNQLYAALQRRRNSRAIWAASKAKPQSAHWIKLGI